MSDRPKAVVAGWFSYQYGHATGGDLLARDVLCEWLDELSIEHVTAVEPPFTGGPRLDDLDPAQFTHAFFVCGPFGRGPLCSDFLTRFAGGRLIGVNLSLKIDPQEWQPFDFVIERDSVRATNPDVVFASHNSLPPVIGICLREPHPQADVEAADRAIHRLLDRHEAARVPIGTRLDVDDTGLRTKGEIEAVISRMDAIVTTRLHGVVLALKNGVPALAVDSVPGGGKVSRQCIRIGWPNVLRLDELDDERLDGALAYALSDEARVVASDCAVRAVDGVDVVKAQLVRELTGRGELERHFQGRQGDTRMATFLASVQPVVEKRPMGWRGRIARFLGKLRA